MAGTTSIVIGAGHAGLAMSRCLTERSIDHVVLERGEVANSWRRERWDSLRLLTPNWQTKLPGRGYQGADPDGFMKIPEVVDFVASYARAIDAPVRTQTRVTTVTRTDAGYHVATDQGDWDCKTLVLASGACNLPSIPKISAAVPAEIPCFTPFDYGNPDRLPEGGVLVVGASATGAQLAEELHLSGRPVTLAVGSHVRLPRRYRGRDIMEWMDAAGLLDERAEAVPDLAAARRQPSLQLVGRPRGALDLGHLAGLGVAITGRALGVQGERLTLATDLAAQIAAAERRRRRVLARIDTHIAAAGIAAPEEPGAWEPPALPGRPRTGLDLRAAGIATVVWATGFLRDYSWLGVPVLDAAGELVHDRGVTPAPGLYALGLRFLRRRSSSFIDGVGRDAEELAAEVALRLRHRPARAA
jgi:putative flavoprotein involved in K+ transport